MHQKNKQSGFTIIEISLAMAFIATLLIAVLTVSMQMMSLYNKGLTIKDVNTVARSTVRDIQDSVAQSSSAIKLVAATPGASVATTLQDASTAQLHYYNYFDATNPIKSGGGRLCTGSFTYIWNYQKAFAAYAPDPGGEFESVQYIKNPAGDFEPIRFIKVRDEARDLCKYVDSGPIGERNMGKRLPDSVWSTMQPVFGEGDRNLAIYAFEVSSPESLVFSTSNQNDTTVPSVNTNFYSTFYTFKITVGSSLFPDDINDSKCEAEAGSKDINVEYCAINDINFVARTGQY